MVGNTRGCAGAGTDLLSGCLLATLCLLGSGAAPAQVRPDDHAPAPQPEGTLPVSLDRIRRSLDAEPAGDGLDLDLSEYVVVFGRASELPAAETVDLQGGSTMHNDIMSVARPSRVDQAAGSDALGVASASLVGALVPLAVSAVAGWFSDDPEEGPPPWTAYTRSVVVTPSSGRETLAFHRLDGQRVGLHVGLASGGTAGVALSVDETRWDTIAADVADRTIPAELFRQGTPGNIHRLAMNPTVGYEGPPLTVDLLLVVHARNDE